MAGPSDRLARALELLAAGARQRAHKIVQQEKSALAAWLHGIEESGQGEMRILSFIHQPDVITKILQHLGLWEKAHASPRRDPAVRVDAPGKPRN